MKDLSMHLMDIAQNAIRAKATEVKIEIEDQGDQRRICIEDNGKGMDEVLLSKVTDPFCTSRTTRKVGLGIPLIKQNAEQTGGRFRIASTLGKGTTLEAVFMYKHWDCPPWGELAATVAMLMSGNPELNIIFSYSREEESFTLSTEEIKEVLDGWDIRLPKVVNFLKDMINENLNELQVEF